MEEKKFLLSRRESRYQKKRRVNIIKKTAVSFAVLYSSVAFMTDVPEKLAASIAVILVCTAFLGVLAFAVINGCSKIGTIYASAKEFLYSMRQATAAQVPVPVRENIIDKPHLKTFKYRLIELFISLLVWTLFLQFVVQPLATILVWVISGIIAHRQFTLSAGYAETMQLIIWAIVIGVAAFMVMLAWANWNYWIYGRLNRRKYPPPVTQTDLAIHYNIKPEVVRQAQSLKIGTIFVDRDNHKGSWNVVFKQGILCLFFLITIMYNFFISFPACQAATAVIPLSSLGYEREITVTGARQVTVLEFPMPLVDFKTPGTHVILLLEPHPNLDGASAFNVYLNDRLAGSYSVNQLRANPSVRLQVPQDAVNYGKLEVRINANLFATTQICSDYERGWLTYKIKEQSALNLDYTPRPPRSIAEFFAGLVSNLLVVVPDNPTETEATAGIWAYGILKKQFPYLAVNLITESERHKYPGAGRVWIAGTGRLPQGLAQYSSGLHLAHSDTVLITAQDEPTLLANVRQLADLTVFKYMPGSSFAVAHSEAGSASFNPSVYFGNNTAQMGRLIIPIDFALYPSQLSNPPGKILVHLEGKYSPSGIEGKPVRMDVFFNRQLIHSEELKSSGELNTNIAVPSAVPIKFKNDLNIELHYPKETAYCQVSGTPHYAQIYTTSYYSGEKRLPSDKYGWENAGIFFNKPGAILVGQPFTVEKMQAAAQMVVLMNKMLPPKIFAYPEIKATFNPAEINKAEYYIVMALQGEVPSEVAKLFPLELDKEYMLNKNANPSVTYRYQPTVNNLLGQIGEYKGKPILAMTTPYRLSFITQMLQQLKFEQLALLYGNIMVMDENGSLFLSDGRNVLPVNSVLPNWLIAGLDRIFRFVTEYKFVILTAAGLLAGLAIGKFFFVRRR